MRTLATPLGVSLRLLLAGALVAGAVIPRTGAAQAASGNAPLQYHGVSVGSLFKDLRKQLDRIVTDVTTHCDLVGSNRDRDCRDLVVRLKPDQTEARIPRLTMDPEFRVVLLEFRVDAPGDVSRQQVLNAFVSAWGAPNDSSAMPSLTDAAAAAVLGRWTRDSTRAMVTLFPASQGRTPEIGIQLRLDRATGRPAFAP